MMTRMEGARIAGDTGAVGALSLSIYLSSNKKTMKE
jgi:hypothetical protein